MNEVEKKVQNIIINSVIHTFAQLISEDHFLLPKKKLLENIYLFIYSSSSSTCNCYYYLYPKKNQKIKIKPTTTQSLLDRSGNKVKLISCAIVCYKQSICDKCAPFSSVTRSKLKLVIRVIRSTFWPGLNLPAYLTIRLNYTSPAATCDRSSCLC